MSKQAPQDVLYCLIQLRTELRQCPESEFEQRRGAMLALVNVALDEKLQQNHRRNETIEAVQAMFIEEVITGDPPSLEAMKARYAKLRGSIVGLDAGGLLHLFTALEWKAVTVIQSLKALAQTTKPGKIAEQCPWLPGHLIRNAGRALKAEKIKAGNTMTNKGKESVRAAWIAAGMDKRRAERGELARFCAKMATAHNCDADTIRKNWIPTWRKQMPPT